MEGGKGRDIREGRSLEKALWRRKDVGEGRLCEKEGVWEIENVGVEGNRGGGGTSQERLGSKQEKLGSKEGESERRAVT